MKCFNASRCNSSRAPERSGVSRGKQGRAGVDEKLGALVAFAADGPAFGMGHYVLIFAFACHGRWFFLSVREPGGEVALRMREGRGKKGSFVGLVGAFGMAFSDRKATT